ncbi:succinate dehydrogenase [Pusillimonas sp. MFBS29]|uniref:succinate dehydrogenase n=1 Tax=Pusillimonas sp. MFBS29 TaxID=2886690 RepID=UPI001D12548B|nr:succinate dehydrogenase [Pusillimonas sp. MFBS29]MCC2597635.1 succinate dehydrogenase [Pusillimonas sp. MFBS29]
MTAVNIQGARRWYWQRITAMAMAAFVTIHLFVIIYAIQGGLSAAEILARTRGNLLWGLFYAAFVGLVAVHASIGIRNVLVEWCSLGDSTATWASRLLALILLIMGLRAVWAVTFGGAA